MARHPQLKVHIDVEHSRVALFERNYDIVFSAIEHSVRAVEHRDAAGVLARAGAVRRAGAAGEAPGALAAPEDLDALPLLAGADDADWEFTGADGATAKVEVRNPRLRSGNAGDPAGSGDRGPGRGADHRHLLRRRRAAGRLVRCCPGWRCAPLRIYALLPGRRLMPAKVREFLDALEACRASA